mmetsp:Transcript_58069/g.168516  ORF Transcript_58069/g.168516 Transcript_58069/m.168516 type:complete len:285 (+) Transcript_58069:191-1045(+)
MGICPGLLVLFPEEGGQQPVGGHGREELRLREDAQQHDQGQQRELPAPHEPRAPAEAALLEGMGEACAGPGLVGPGGAERELREAGEQRGQQQRADEGPGHRLRGIPGLRGHATHFVEADEAEEKLRGRREHGRRTAGEEGRGRLEHVPRPEREARADHEEDQDDLKRRDEVDDDPAAVHAAGNQRRAQEHHDAGQGIGVVVLVAVAAWRGSRGAVVAQDPPRARSVVEFRGPRPRHARAGDAVLHGQAHGPRHGGELPEGVVAEDVGGALSGQPRGELHVGGA